MKTDQSIKLDKLRVLIEEEIQLGKFSSNMLQHIRSKELPRLNESQIRSHYEALLKTFIDTAHDYSSQVSFEEIGTVQHIGNGVANISGLSNVGLDELVLFPNGVNGLVLNLESHALDVILLGNEQGIHGGDQVTSRRERLKIPVGPDLLGRVIDPLGQPLDNQRPIRAVDFDFLEKPAPGIIQRSPVNEPLQTGLKIVDALFPIGRGQRELIIGDRQTGKTALVVDCMLNQKDSNVLCMYVSIGQKKSSVLSVINTLQKHNVMQYCTVIVANPDDPPALRYLAPFSGSTIAEYFLDQGRDVLVIFDDLGKHADAYREISLLLRRPPGREAYPGDIFYLHARLLERAGKLNQAQGGGSLTALPIIPMQQGNLSAYIPTNLISICDGQIVLSTEKFNRGLKPAVNIGLSVSRVGGSAQNEAMRSVSEDLKLELSQFEEVEQFTRFGTEIDQATLRQIQRGQKLQWLLTQPNERPLSMAEEVISLNAGIKGFLDQIELNQIHKYESKLLAWFKREHTDIIHTIQYEKSIARIQDELLQLLEEFNQTWTSGAE